MKNKEYHRFGTRKANYLCPKCGALKRDYMNKFYVSGRAVVCSRCAHRITDSHRGYKEGIMLSKMSEEERVKYAALDIFKQFAYRQKHGGV